MSWIPFTVYIQFSYKEVSRWDFMHTHRMMSVVYNNSLVVYQPHHSIKQTEVTHIVKCIRWSTCISLKVNKCFECWRCYDQSSHNIFYKWNSRNEQQSIEFLVSAFLNIGFECRHLDRLYCCDCMLLAHKFDGLERWLRYNFEIGSFHQQQT